MKHLFIAIFVAGALSLAACSPDDPAEEPSGGNGGAADSSPLAAGAPEGPDGTADGGVSGAAQCPPNCGPAAQTVRRALHYAIEWASASFNEGFKKSCLSQAGLGSIHNFVPEGHGAPCHKDSSCESAKEGWVKHYEKAGFKCAESQTSRKIAVNGVECGTYKSAAITCAK